MSNAFKLMEIHIFFFLQNLQRKWLDSKFLKQWFSFHGSWSRLKIDGCFLFICLYSNRMEKRTFELDSSEYKLPQVEWNNQHLTIWISIEFLISFSISRWESVYIQKLQTVFPHNCDWGLRQNLHIQSLWVHRSTSVAETFGYNCSCLQFVHSISHYDLHGWKTRSYRWWERKTSLLYEIQWEFGGFRMPNIPFLCVSDLFYRWKQKWFKA